MNIASKIVGAVWTVVKAPYTLSKWMVDTCRGKPRYKELRAPVDRSKGAIRDREVEVEEGSKGKGLEDIPKDVLGLIGGHLKRSERAALEEVMPQARRARMQKRQKVKILFDGERGEDCKNALAFANKNGMPIRLDLPKTSEGMQRFKDLVKGEGIKPFKLYINSAEQLQELATFLISNPKLAKNVRELNVMRGKWSDECGEITAKMQDAVNELCSTVKHMSNLHRLSFGDIGEGVTVKLDEGSVAGPVAFREIKGSVTLDKNFRAKHICADYVRKNATLMISEGVRCDRLDLFEIAGAVSVPAKLGAKEYYFGRLYKDGSLTLPDLIQAENIKFEVFSKRSTLTLPKVLQVKNAEFGDIIDDFTLTLPEIFQAQNVKFGNLKPGTVLSFPEGFRAENFKAGDLMKGSVLSLPVGFQAKDVEFGNIQSLSELRLSVGFRAENVVFGSLWEDSNVSLPVLFRAENIAFGTIWPGSNISLPKGLRVSNAKFEKIESHAVLTFPERFQAKNVEFVSLAKSSNLTFPEDFKADSIELGHAAAVAFKMLPDALKEVVRNKEDEDEHSNM